MSETIRIIEKPFHIRMTCERDDELMVYRQRVELVPGYVPPGSPTSANLTLQVPVAQLTAKGES